MRVVVTGLVATYPLGGVAWDYLAYVEGFRRLGADVLYLEDSGGWFYDPRAQTFTDRVEANIRFLEQALGAVDCAAVPWSVRDPNGNHFGAGPAAVARFCRRADLFLNVSGSCWLREEYRGARCTAYLDSDPGYVQAKLQAVACGRASADQEFSVGLIRAHDRFLTFAEHIGAADCRLPSCGLAWIVTRQPIVLERWPFTFTPAARRFTTVMSWKTEVKPPEIDGAQYGAKDIEMERFLSVAERSGCEIELAVSGAAPRERLRAAGWQVADGGACSATMDLYRDYLRASRAEWSVAKNVYAALRSGWFSGRSGAYLALGKPVIVQDTGWSEHYPTGAGLFAFDTVGQAVEALRAVDADYRRHCEAARALAESELAAERVLTRLLAELGL